MSVGPAIYASSSLAILPPPPSPVYKNTLLLLLLLLLLLVVGLVVVLGHSAPSFDVHIYTETQAQTEREPKRKQYHGH